MICKSHLYIFFLVFAICKNLCDSLSAQRRNVIFSKFRCSMFCAGQPHTLCDEHFEEFNRDNCSQEGHRLDAKDYLKMKRQLIIGHNGLRNRIAGVMRVANMMELIWNDDLALMAERHIRRCTPYDDDICTHLNQSLEYEKTHFHLKGKELDSFCKVSQNRYYQKQVHYPNIIVENALRTWYREKLKMDPPEEAFDELHMHTNGILKGENNFTHLAYPLAAYFGCSMNKVYDGFLLLCNYHPYERGDVVDFEFIKGNPGDHCPLTRPLKNRYERFTNLCIGLERNAWSTAHSNHYSLIFYILICIRTYYEI